MPGVAVLPQAVGYAVVLGIGFFFAALMLGMSWIFNRYSDTKSGSAEEFTSASRSVKPGLVAAGIGKPILAGIYTCADLPWISVCVDMGCHALTKLRRRIQIVSTLPMVRSSWAEAISPKVAFLDLTGKPL